MKTKYTYNALIMCTCNNYTLFNFSIDHCEDPLGTTGNVEDILGPSRDVDPPPPSNEPASTSGLPNPFPQPQIPTVAPKKRKIFEKAKAFPCQIEG